MLKTERAIINMGEPDAGCMSQEERVYFFDAIFKGILALYNGVGETQSEIAPSVE